MSLGERVYFATSKRGQPASLLRRCVQVLSASFPGAQIAESNNLNWNALVREHGDQTAAFIDVVNGHDHVVVLEDEGFLGRGLYDTLKFAAELGKFRWVIRPVGDNQFKIFAVKLAVVHDEKDWHRRYGKIEIGDERVMT